MTRDVSSGPEPVLGTQSKTGSLQLVAALTANTTRRINLIAALTLHKVSVIRQCHRRTRLHCNRYTSSPSIFHICIELKLIDLYVDIVCRNQRHHVMFYH